MPVSQWERNEWIATFLLGLALLVSRLAAYLLTANHYSKSKQAQTTTTTTTIGTQQEAEDTTSDAFRHSPPLPSFMVGVPTTTLAARQAEILHLPINSELKSKQRFLREGLHGSSTIFLLGFILLIANAALSKTMGYVSQSTMALSWSLMALFLTWGILVLFLRNHLLPLVMMFLIIILFVAYWSLVFYQTIGV